MVRLGGSLGLYETLYANGPMTSAQLAKAAKVHERYLREWLSHQAASNYLAYDPKTETFTLPPEQAMVFVNEESPVYIMGGFDLMTALLDNQPKVQAAFKTGDGVAWGAGLYVLCGGAFLQARVPQLSCATVAPRSRRRRR
jgi:hypothetical protein